MSNTYEFAARLYDLDYRDRSDVPFFRARAQGGSVLELACGTGRVSLALAENGARVHGLDLSPQMLGVFREKLSPVNCFAPKRGMRKWGYPETVRWERDGVVCKSFGGRVDTERQIIYPVMVYETGGERIEEPLTLRYWYPRQLRKRLRQAGFRVVERFGDFEGGPVKQHGGDQIYVCEVAS